MEGNLGEAPSRPFPGISPRRVGTRGRIVLWSSAGGTSCRLCVGAGFGFLSACWRFLHSGLGGGRGYRPCLSAWLSGCSQATSRCTPVPRLPALLRLRGNCPWAGSTLGLLRRVLPQVLWSETLPFLLSFHRPHRHRISKEEARSEAEPEGRPASALSTEPLPWDSDQRTTGPRARH